MSINIEWQKLPQKEDKSGEERLYPRLTGNGTIDLDTICKNAEKRSVYDRAHLKGAYTILADAIAAYLAEGKTVVLPDLGSLQLIITAEDAPGSTTRHPENRVKVKGVRFQASEELLQQIGQPQFKTAVHTSTPTSLPLDELARQLTAYLTEHTSITRSAFEQLFHLKRSTANVRLSELIKMGIIVPEGSNRDRRYVLK